MDTYYLLMGGMAVLAVIVFIALFFFKAGYGYLGNGNWGPKINNRLGWIIMECPAFLFMLLYTVRYALSGTGTGNSSLYMGEWLFRFAPAGKYGLEWLASPQFIIGTLLFLAGMLINLDSDYVIRHLRKPGDTRHYIPRQGLYKYVTSANYFGELTEWVGYAILTWSPAGLLFAVWTFANLAPRAKALTARYEEEFGDEYRELHKKHLIPFIW